MYVLVVTLCVIFEKPENMWNDNKTCHSYLQKGQIGGSGNYHGKQYPVSNKKIQFWTPFEENLDKLGKVDNLSKC